MLCSLVCDLHKTHNSVTQKPVSFPFKHSKVTGLNSRTPSSEVGRGRWVAGREQKDEMPCGDPETHRETSERERGCRF